MNNNDLKHSLKTSWQQNKPFLLLLLSLLAVLSILKIIFYNYNYHLLFSNTGTEQDTADKLKMAMWSLRNDGLILLLINGLFLLTLQATRRLNTNLGKWIVLPFFIMLNGFVILLNLFDIFYFSFHFQRANADLLFVLDHPLKRLLQLDAFQLAILLLLIIIFCFLCWKLHYYFFRSFKSGHSAKLVSLVLVLAFGCLLIFNKQFSKILVPAYPLVALNSKQLTVVQNSFHSFTYSLFRRGQDVGLKNYMSPAESDAVLILKKPIPTEAVGQSPKNMVLFIMESVPFDFFDTTSRFKVALPFFDSIIQKSSFYYNAFSYSHHSNKGITAILAGLPTLSDIPVYHSPYVNMDITHLGSALKKNNYHSLFCIGDDFDNFGFAKCVRWLGFDKYYSREDMKAYEQYPAHTMGMHDEYSLDFMLTKINQAPAPFLAVNYNVSTHFPYDLPENFKPAFPEGYTRPMKSMQYYDHSLRNFFNGAQQQSWFNNTVFIFCSDHWLLPDDKKRDFNSISGYRIPILIYEPSKPVKRSVEQLVSQFDVMGTLLSISGYKDSVISYGGSLLEAPDPNKKMVVRINSNLYQVIDSAWTLGFNKISNKAEYLYHYKTDPKLKDDQLGNELTSPIANRLTIYIKAFLQKAGQQYNRVPFN